MSHVRQWFSRQALDPYVGRVLWLRWAAIGCAIGAALFTGAVPWYLSLLALAYNAVVHLWLQFAPRLRAPMLWLAPDVLVFGRLAYAVADVFGPAYLLFLASAAWAVAVDGLLYGGLIGLGLGMSYEAAVLLATRALPDAASLSGWLALALGLALVGGLSASLGRLLRAAQERMVQQGKVAEELRALEQLKSDFLSTVSHEFRTPLTAIKVSVGLLADKLGGSDGEQQRLMSTILRNVDRLNQMVGGVLEMARLQSGKVVLQKRSVDACQVVREIAGSLQPLMDEKDQLFTLRLPDAPVFLMADANRLEQILSNLLSNAQRYTPKGGEIAVEVRELGNWVRIYVSDTGPGIPYNELPHIFDRFYRGQVGRKAGPGTGLGLSIARSLARLHGGDVGVSTKPGEGCVFFVTLPKEEAVGEVPGSG